MSLNNNEDINQAENQQKIIIFSVAVKWKRGWNASTKGALISFKMYALQEHSSVHGQQKTGANPGEKKMRNFSSKFYISIESTTGVWPNILDYKFLNQKEDLAGRRKNCLLYPERKLKKSNLKLSFTHKFFYYCAYFYFKWFKKCGESKK